MINLDPTINTLLFFFSTLFFSLITYNIKKLEKSVERILNKYYELEIKIQELIDKYKQLEKEIEMMKKKTDR